MFFLWKTSFLKNTFLDVFEISASGSLCAWPFFVGSLANLLLNFPVSLSINEATRKVSYGSLQPQFHFCSTCGLSLVEFLVWIYLWVHLRTFTCVCSCGMDLCKVTCPLVLVDGVVCKVSRCVLFFLVFFFDSFG